MELAWLVQIDAQLRGSGTAFTIRLASHDNDVLCHHNGLTWWPSIARLPVLRRDIFDGDFGGAITAPDGDIEVAVEGVPGFATATLAGARIRLWSTDNFGASSVDLRFDGLVDAEPTVRDQIAVIAFRVDDRWLDEPLLPVYAGTGNAEGDSALKGQVKPICLGAPKFVEGVLVNSIDSVVQVSVGPIAGIDFSRESCVRFPAPVADYASYSALVAATIAPGFVATCLAEGLVRHGAPPDGVLAYDVQGLVSGTQPRKAGAVLTALAARQGHSAKVDAAAMTAIDTARPWNISLVLNQQTTLREVAQRIAASINAVAIVRWTGLLALIPVDAPAALTEAGTLAADGTALPPVAEVAQLPIAAPFWRLALQAEATHRVHSPDEIRFTARINPRGIYDAAETYREGDLVSLADGSMWLYTAVTPTSGNTPVDGSAFWNASSPPLFNPRGDYVPSTIYYPGDTVVWTTAGGGDGGGYRRIGTGPTDFTPPSNASYWAAIVESGSDGAPGADGADGADGVDGVDGADGATGATGVSIRKIWQRSATAPSAPAASATTPSGWFDDPASATGSNVLYASTGERAAGGTNYTWATPVRDEAITANQTGQPAQLAFTVSASLSFTLLPGQSRQVTGQGALDAPTGGGSAYVQIEQREEGGSWTASNGSSEPYAVGEPALPMHEIVVTNPGTEARNYEVRGTVVRVNTNSGPLTASRSKLVI